MHVIFTYLQVAAVVRFGVYCWIRFSSQEAFTDWIPISDVYFYIIYCTELWITIGMFAFLFDQAAKQQSKLKAEEMSFEQASV